MADPNRLKADSFVNHHAVTPLWDEKSKAEIAQWFSDNGFARAYGSNPNNWSGLINPFTGKRSYAQAHAVGQRVTDRTPDATAAERAAGYRVFWIVADPWGQITWGAGNWEVNRRAINVEHLGDYRNYALREGDIRVIAAFWRGRDQELKGATYVYGHLEVTLTGTQCPARIMEGRDLIVKYINNPPSPPQPSRPTWVPMDNPRHMLTASDLYVVDLTTGKNVGEVIKKGTDIDFRTKTEWQGSTFLRSKSSTDNKRDWGINIKNLVELPVPEPTPDPVPEPTDPVEPTPIPEDPEIPPAGNGFVRFLQWVFNSISEFIKNFNSKKGK